MPTRVRADRHDPVLSVRPRCFLPSALSIANFRSSLLSNAMAVVFFAASGTATVGGGLWSAGRKSRALQTVQAEVHGDEAVGGHIMTALARLVGSSSQGYVTAVRLPFRAVCGYVLLLLLLLIQAGHTVRYRCVRFCPYWAGHQHALHRLPSPPRLISILRQMLRESRTERRGGIGILITTSATTVARFIVINAVRWQESRMTVCCRSCGVGN